MYSCWRTVIAPVAVLNESPGIEVEISGSIAHASGAPPALVGVAPLTRLFLVNVNGEPAYEMSGCFILNSDRNGCRNITCGIVGPNGERSG